MLTWKIYRENHPEVLASWAQQNGREPSCTCERCKPHHDQPAPTSTTGE